MPPFKSLAFLGFGKSVSHPFDSVEQYLHVFSASLVLIEVRMQLHATLCTDVYGWRRICRYSSVAPLKNTRDKLGG